MKPDDTIELDVDLIAKRADVLEKENVRFCAYLKNQDGDEIDKLVYKLNEMVSNTIDCTACGNCCKDATPCLSKRDVERLAVAKKVTDKEIEEQYTVLENEERICKTQPCSFLKDNKCTVYELRPDDCRTYPHLDKKDFVHRLWMTLENYAICPIVYNVFEKLKGETGFKRY